MSRVHTWKASSQVKARLTSNSIFITFLEDAQLKTFSERIPSSASLAYPSQKLLKNISSRKYLSLSLCSLKITSLFQPQTSLTAKKNLSLKKKQQAQTPLTLSLTQKNELFPLRKCLQQQNLTLKQEKRPPYLSPCSCLLPLNNLQLLQIPPCQVSISDWLSKTLF